MEAKPWGGVAAFGVYLVLVVGAVLGYAYFYAATVEHPVVSGWYGDPTALEAEGPVELFTTTPWGGERFTNDDVLRRRAYDIVLYSLIGVVALPLLMAGYYALGRRRHPLQLLSAAWMGAGLACLYGIFYFLVFIQAMHIPYGEMGGIEVFLAPALSVVLALALSIMVGIWAAFEAIRDRRREPIDAAGSSDAEMRK